MRHAVTAAERLTDPTEAAIAVGLARRQQRMVRRDALIVLPLQIGLAITWLWMLLPPARLPVAFRWFWAVVLALLVGVVPLVLRHRYLEARRTIAANHDAAGR